MRTTLSWSLSASLILALLLAMASAVSCTASAASCPACGRAECKNLAFVIRLRDGGEVKTCCPRCGLHYIDSEHPQVASMSVRDFDRAEPLRAESTFYVEGSDVTPCASSHSSAPQDERGCCFKAVYDRCLPSILAFRSKMRAGAFAREHGGVVKVFSELGTTAARAGSSAGS